MDEELLSQAKQEAVLDYAIRNAAAAAKDPEILAWLLGKKAKTLEEIGEVLGEIRSEKPYLFSDEGGRPRFSAETMDKLLSNEDEAVAERYRGNPWYRRK